MEVIIKFKDENAKIQFTVNNNSEYVAAITRAVKERIPLKVVDGQWRYKTGISTCVVGPFTQQFFKAVEVRPKHDIEFVSAEIVVNGAGMIATRNSEVADHFEECNAPCHRADRNAVIVDGVLYVRMDEVHMTNSLADTIMKRKQKKAADLLGMTVDEAKNLFAL